MCTCVYCAFVLDEQWDTSAFGCVPSAHAKSHPHVPRACTDPFKLSACGFHAQRRKGAAADGAAEAAAAAAAAVGKKWSKGDLRLVEDRLLALGPGRYSLMMTQLHKETATIGNKPLTGGKPFARSQAEVQTLCESIIAVINASEEIVRATPGVGGGGKAGSAAAAKEAREAGGVKKEDRGGDGEEGEDGEGGGEKAGKGDVTLSAEAKEEKELAMKAELNARVEQLQPVLKVGGFWTSENFNGCSEMNNSDLF